MKVRWLVSMTICFFLSACGTHYYRKDGNTMTLVLRRPQAERVDLACSLYGFHPRSAKKIAGRWEVTLPADKSFTYFYRVDGALFLPDCPMREKDDFGSQTCIFDPRL